MDSPAVQFRPHGIYGRQISLLQIAVVLQIFVYLAVAVKSYSRKLRKLDLGFDDLLLAAAVFFGTVMTAMLVAGLFYGYGVPGAELSSSDKKTAILVFYLVQITYKLVIGCCKLYFCFMYRRIFPSFNRKLHRATTFLIIFVATYTATALGATILLCAPIARYWDRSIEGQCIDVTVFWYINGSYNVVTDFLLIIIPVSTCCKLQIKKKEMIGVCLIFSVGIFIIITSILRISTLNLASKATDLTNETFTSTIWTNVEAHTAVIVACLPSFKAPVMQLWNRFAPASSLGRSAQSVNQIEHRGRRGPSRSDLLLISSSRGDIAVVTDIEVQYEHRSGGSSLAT